MVMSAASWVLRPEDRESSLQDAREMEAEACQERKEHWAGGLEEIKRDVDNSVQAWLNLCLLYFLLLSQCNSKSPNLELGASLTCLWNSYAATRNHHP